MNSSSFTNSGLTAQDVDNHLSPEASNDLKDEWYIDPATFEFTDDDLQLFGGTSSTDDPHSSQQTTDSSSSQHHAAVPKSPSRLVNGRNLREDVTAQSLAPEVQQPSIIAQQAQDGDRYTLPVSNPRPAPRQRITGMTPPWDSSDKTKVQVNGNSVYPAWRKRKPNNPLKDGDLQRLVRQTPGVGLEWLDEVNSEWIPAVYHREIRSQLLDIASHDGQYQYHHARARGRRINDITAFHYEQAMWSEDEASWVHIRDEVLFKLDRGDYVGKYDNDELRWMMFDGRLVIDDGGWPVRLFPDLPLAISSQVEAFALAAYARLDKRVQSRDIWGRIPHMILQKSGELRSKFVCTQITNKWQRWLASRGIPMWGGHSEKEEIIRNRLDLPANPSIAGNNSTKGHLKALDIEEGRKVRDVSKGKRKRGSHQANGPVDQNGFSIDSKRPKTNGAGTAASFPEPHPGPESSIAGTIPSGGLPNNGYSSLPPIQYSLPSISPYGYLLPAHQPSQFPPTLPANVQEHRGLERSLTALTHNKAAAHMGSNVVSSGQASKRLKISPVPQLPSVRSQLPRSAARLPAQTGMMQPLPSQVPRLPPFFSGRRLPPYVSDFRPMQNGASSHHGSVQPIVPAGAGTYESSNRVIGAPAHQPPPSEGLSSYKAAPGDEKNTRPSSEGEVAKHASSLTPAESDDTPVPVGTNTRPGTYSHIPSPKHPSVLSGPSHTTNDGVSGSQNSRFGRVTEPRKQSSRRYNPYARPQSPLLSSPRPARPQVRASGTDSDIPSQLYVGSSADVQPGRVSRGTPHISSAPTAPPATSSHIPVAPAPPGYHEAPAQPNDITLPSSPQLGDTQPRPDFEAFLQRELEAVNAQTPFPESYIAETAASTPSRAWDNVVEHRAPWLSEFREGTY